MRVVPYVSTAGVLFGSKEEDICNALGQPSRREYNRLEQLELIYDFCTFRLSKAEGKLVEATANSECFEIEGLRFPGKGCREIAFVELGYAIAKLDKESFLCHGFVVSPAFGLAFDPQFHPYLTVFARTELPGWQDVA